MILASLLLLCAQGPHARSAEWREALELDLPATVLQEGPRMVTAGGELHTDGEAVALVARALFVTGKETLAKSLLRDARPSEDTQVYIALERARIALDEDDRVCIKAADQHQGAAARSQGREGDGNGQTLDY